MTIYIYIYIYMSKFLRRRLIILEWLRMSCLLDQNTEYTYLPTPLLEQDAKQGKFLSGVQQV